MSGAEPLLDEVVVKRFDAADKRAATLSGAVFLSSDLWSGEKKL